MRPGAVDGSETESETTYNIDNTRQSSNRAFNVRITPTARKSTSRRQNLVSNSSPKGAARRKMYHARELKQLKEMAKLQKLTTLMIPKAPFSRAIREISLSINSEITRYTTTALEAIQEATEMFLTQVLSDSYLLTLHRKCVTLSVADMALLRALKLDL